MHVMIIGAAGMIGRKLANKIAETSTLGGKSLRHLSLVDDSLRHSHASPRAAVGFLIRAATMDSAVLEGWCNLSMPGHSATVREQIDALERVAGSKTVALIRREPDPAITAIVGGWPQNLGAERTKKLGFVAEQRFDEIIQIYIDDELGGTLPTQQ